MIKKSDLIKKKADDFIASQKNIETLRFITCGSVDDGKSTLIGRLLYDSKVIFTDQLDDIKTVSGNNNNNNFDYSLLLDGLKAEREQKITIDVAYRYFQTPKRRFIVADTPGHEQYTKNMVTGASTADVAIILINAKKGIIKQTLRHSYICSLLGIERIILIVNKMDLVKFSKKKFESVRNEYIDKVKSLNFLKIMAIPVSATLGDNIIRKSKNTDWFKGKPLLKVLESIDILSKKQNRESMFSVQYVGLGKNNTRSYLGIIRAGFFKKNQKITVYPSLENNIIKKIIFYKKEISKATEGESVNILLKKELDISRGYIFSSTNTDIELSDHFQSKLIWFSKNQGFVGRLYFMKIGGFILDAQITKIKNIINIKDYSEKKGTKLEFNDISIIEISVNKKIPFKNYKENKSLGSFILIDRISNETVAAGMIIFSMLRSSNIFESKHEISKIKRNLLNGHNSKVLWFTGLSGSGKSTIANNLEKKLYRNGIKTFILDGDNIRKGLNKDLGFKLEDRVENIRRIAEVSRIMVDAGVVVLVAFISPFKAERNMARNLFEKGEFIEIFVDASLKTVEKRDVKGLYLKARRGQILNFTGIDSPYEVPENPEIILKTDNQSISKTINYLLKKLNFDLI